MRSEREIRDRLERIEDMLENTAAGPDNSHLIGQRNVLLWVLNDDSVAPGSGGEHWTGQSGGQRR